MMKQSLWVSLLLFSTLSTLYGGWITKLGRLQQQEVTRQSYLRGLLSRNSYGIYRINSAVAFERLRTLYAQNGYRLLWEGKKGSIREMIDWIARSDKEGLEPRRYHYRQITALQQRIQERAFRPGRDWNLALVTRDILLSDAFLGLSHDLNEGLIDPWKFRSILKERSQKEQVTYSWALFPPRYTYTRLLRDALAKGKVHDSLSALVGDNEIYEGLAKAYRRYRAIVLEGGWQPIPSGGVLRRGAQGRRVDLLAKRLAATGDLRSYDGSYRYFDTTLAEALRRFQLRHGIWASGVMTEETRRALNVPAQERLAQIRINLEHSRWEKHSYGDTYIWVNIPAFRMFFFREGEAMLSMRVIVGRKKNPTPVFSAQMSYAVLNPYWSVPDSIVKKEMLPRLQEDPDYLAGRKFKAYDSWKAGRQPIDPEEVDWYQYDENSTVPYVFVRDPGAGNPLGRMKFIFPNPYAVYMHDTPNKGLFKNRMRAYSHGCIRLHHPQKLLDLLSKAYMDTPRTKVFEILKKGENASVRLNRQIPVHIRYYTVWADTRGVLHFRPYDIYGYDRIFRRLIKNDN